MAGRGTVRTTLIALVVALAGAPCALAKAPTEATFLDVFSNGQGQNLTLDQANTNDLPPSYTDQLPLYTGLIGAGPTLSSADLPRFFKAETLDVPSGSEATFESPRPGVTIARDRFHVPHVTGATRADTMFGAGYAQAEDRLWQMDSYRYYLRAEEARLYGSDAIGDDSFVVTQLDYTPAELTSMFAGLAKDFGGRGRQVQEDIRAYVDGINAFVARTREDPSLLPGEYSQVGVDATSWSVEDVLLGLIDFNDGGTAGAGYEHFQADLLNDLQARLGPAGGRAVLDDLARADDPESTTITDRPAKSPFPESKKATAGVAVQDPGSLQPYDPVVTSARRRRRAAPRSSRLSPPVRDRNAPESNAILVGPKRSATGAALAVMGPQDAHYAPHAGEMEITLDGPGVSTRGLTYPGVAPYVFIGRGADFAWSRTIGFGDNTDMFAERLCNADGSPATLASRSYEYKGRCLPFERHDVYDGLVTLRSLRSVHGPVQWFATVDGRPVAYTRASALRFHETGTWLTVEALNTGAVHDPASFRSAVELANSSRDWFYLDSKHISFLMAGWYPRRADGTDRLLPTWGTGEWDWKGFKPKAYEFDRLGDGDVPHDTDPKQGFIAGWNSRPAPGFPPADGVFGWGSIQRVDLYAAPLVAGAGTDLTGLVKLMEDGATQDLRGVRLYPLLRRVLGDPSDPRLVPIVNALDAWAADGAHRRDLDGDNVEEHSDAVLLMDAWWPRLVRGIFQPVLGADLIDEIRFGAQPLADVPGPSGSGFFRGWWSYVDKDLRRVAGLPVAGPLSRKYCGAGVLADCRRVLVDTLLAAADAVREAQGDDQDQWSYPATCPIARPVRCDQTEFFSSGAAFLPPMPWQNRPTFQQVVSLRE